MIHFCLLYLQQKIILEQKKRQKACTVQLMSLYLHRFRDKNGLVA